MALQSIIDRRLAGKNKSIGNRERFLRRYKDKIKDAVRRAVDGRGIRDLERGEEVRIPKKDLSEPVFHHANGGVRDMVHPGNQDYVRGDRIKRPQGGGGSGGSGKGQASDQGDGEDDFSFALSKDEFMQVFFEDLALPHLVRTQLAEVPEWKSHRAGYSSDGTPNNLHVVRSLRGAIGRRLAIGSGSRRELAELEAELAILKAAAEAGDMAGQAGIAGAGREGARAAQPAGAHSLPRPDRPALPQPGEDAGAHQQGGDVLPDGRVGLDGRGPQGIEQALLHPAVPVPDAALREDRHRLHPPPHPGARGGRGELLPCPRDRRHGGQQRPGADGGDHPRPLQPQRVEHLRRPGQRRRQLAPRQRPLPRAAGREDPAAVPLLRLCAGGRGRAEPLGRVPASWPTPARTSRCARPPRRTRSTRSSATCSRRRALRKQREEHDPPDEATPSLPLQGARTQRPVQSRIRGGRLVSRSSSARCAARCR
jgi:hypothetical protein